MTLHRELCDLAVNWLKRPFGRKGHGCSVAVSEFRATAWSGEQPDAIGFRAAGHIDGSVLIEVKTNRPDFLADHRKPHRQTKGMGNWRYYMAPKGMITLAELPPKWGLLEVTEKGHVLVTAGCALILSHLVRRSESDDWRHEVDRDAEQALLIRLLARVGDQERLNRLLADANNRAARLEREAERTRSALYQVTSHE